MTILVTGAAGFIGFHLAKSLLADGRQVIGVDNLNPYYDVSLKEARLKQLEALPGFRFQRTDLSRKEEVETLSVINAEIIVHLAAQAGVRHSIDHPHVYIESNITGQLNMLELAKRSPKLKHFVYASSSSVYGATKQIPFREDDPCNSPMSVYAATKRSAELFAETFSRLYGIKATGLRFFTVYGPWGRPDMAYFSFAEKIMKGEPITIYGAGKPARDFTYIDDISAGIRAAISKVPDSHAIYNLGNAHPEPVGKLVELLEKGLGRKAVCHDAPLPEADAPQTFADLAKSCAALQYAPRTTLEEGISRFIQWYKIYKG